MKKHTKKAAKKVAKKIAKKTPARKPVKTPEPKRPVPRKPAPKANVRKAQKSLLRKGLAELSDAAFPPVVPPEQTAETVSHEHILEVADGALPLFMHWTVVETTKAKGTKIEADLMFMDRKTHTLEGPFAKKMLQEHADHWNQVKYVPDFDLAKRNRARPSRDSFLETGQGTKPFVR